MRSWAGGFAPRLGDGSRFLRDHAPTRPTSRRGFPSPSPKSERYQAKRSMCWELRCFKVSACDQPYFLSSKIGCHKVAYCFEESLQDETCVHLQPIAAYSKPRVVHSSVRKVVVVSTTSACGATGVLKEEEHSPEENSALASVNAACLSDASCRGASQPWQHAEESSARVSSMAARQIFLSGAAAVGAACLDPAWRPGSLSRSCAPALTPAAELQLESPGRSCCTKFAHELVRQRRDQYCSWRAMLESWIHPKGLNGCLTNGQPRTSTSLSTSVHNARSRVTKYHPKI